MKLLPISDANYVFFYSQLCSNQLRSSSLIHHLLRHILLLQGFPAASDTQLGSTEFKAHYNLAPSFLFKEHSFRLFSLLSLVLKQAVSKLSAEKGGAWAMWQEIAYLEMTGGVEGKRKAGISRVQKEPFSRYALITMKLVLQIRSIPHAPRHISNQDQIRTKKPSSPYEGRAGMKIRKYDPNPLPPQ